MREVTTAPKLCSAVACALRKQLKNFWQSFKLKKTRFLLLQFYDAAKSNKKPIFSSRQGVEFNKHGR